MKGKKEISAIGHPTKKEDHCARARTTVDSLPIGLRVQDNSRLRKMLFVPKNFRAYYGDFRECTGFELFLGYPEPYTGKKSIKEVLGVDEEYTYHIGHAPGKGIRVRNVNFSDTETAEVDYSLKRGDVGWMPIKAKIKFWRGL